MTIEINGTSLADHTTAKWIDRGAIGETGQGHSVYPSLRSFEARWDFMAYDDFQTLHDLFENNNVTGTVYAYIPKYKDSTYVYQMYSGCVLKEPSFGDYFEEHYSDVRLLIVRIRLP